MVLWFIGLSGSGKSTLAELVYKQIKPSRPNLVLLDGDVIRTLFGNDVDHSIEGRRKNAERISHLSKFLSDQGINVIAAVLSLFPDWQKWNRDNLENYAEVYLQVSMETLLKRDIKNLYAPAMEGKIKNVVGLDIPFPEPSSDIILDNNVEKSDFGNMVQKILALPAVQRMFQKT